MAQLKFSWISLLLLLLHAATVIAEEAAAEAEEVEAEQPKSGMSIEGQAFLLVIAAGLCTMIGSCVVFFPSLANLAKPGVLAGALGFAAGIMLYISLIDIWGKSADGYAEYGHSDGDAFIYATLTFFGGCAIMLILDVLVDKMLEWDNKRARARGDANLVKGDMGSERMDAADVDKMREDFNEKIASERAVETGDRMNSDMPDEEAAPAKNDEEIDAAAPAVSIKKSIKAGEEGYVLNTMEGEDHEQLTHMGWAMAAAIAIHNFPEGMVTYLAYTQDSAVGAALAIGIAIHNIPEGLCVAMPLYYATGRRWYAFMWGTLSGITEPFGALLVWAVLSSGLSGNVDGILFGIVAGMMTVISVDELIPTAHKYAENGKTVTYWLIFGMLFIASSLMLFEA